MATSFTTSSVDSLKSDSCDVLFIGSEKDVSILDSFKGELRKKFHPIEKPFKENVKALAVVSLIPSHKELVKKLGEAKLKVSSSAHHIVLLPDGYETNVSLLDYLEQVRADRIFFYPSQIDKVSDNVKLILIEKLKHEEAKKLRHSVKSENFELASTKMNLENLIKERTEHLRSSKQELDKGVTKTRGLIQFLKELSSVLSTEDLLQILRRELKQFHHIRELILATHTSQGDYRLHYYQGSQVMTKVIGDHWPEVDKIRSNNQSDRQYLANIFGRPFAQVLAVPLQGVAPEGVPPNVGAILFFEHALGNTDYTRFIDFISPRLYPVSIALERLFLEKDLKEASHTWERTFDGIQDPIAIFDLDGDIIRANKAFNSQLAGLSKLELNKETLRHGDKTYKVKEYPILLSSYEKATNIIKHFHDVTQALSLHRKMIQNEKMVALGHLAGHVAHELNNPLTGVRSLSQVLIKKINKNDTLYEDLVEVEKAAQRCQHIIQNLIEFSQGGVKSRVEKSSINDIITRTLPLLKSALSEINLELNLSEDDLMVSVESQLMQQVIFNIVKNACQAMKGKGRLSINTKKVQKNASEWAEVKISDTGCGISKEALRHIFDFFYTTKDPGQGTGLGLSMSQSIVSQFGGSIEAESEMSKGSDFYIYLPLVK